MNLARIRVVDAGLNVRVERVGFLASLGDDVVEPIERTGQGFGVGMILEQPGAQHGRTAGRHLDHPPPGRLGPNLICTQPVVTAMDDEIR